MLITWLQGRTLPPWLSPVAMAPVTGRGHAATFLHRGVTLVLPLDTVPLIRTFPRAATLGSGAQAPPLGSAASTRTTGRLARLRITCLREDRCYAGSGSPARPHPDRPGLGDCPVSLGVPQACALVALRTRSLSLSGPTRGPGSPTQPRPEEPGSETRVWVQGLLAPQPAEQAVPGRARLCCVRRSLARPHAAICRRRTGVHTDLPGSAPPAWHPHSDRDKPGQGSSFLGQRTASPTLTPSVLTPTNPAPLPPPLQGGCWSAELHTGDCRAPWHRPWPSPDRPSYSVCSR